MSKKQIEKVTTLLQFIGEGKTQGKPLRPRLEIQTGTHRVLQFPGADSPAETNRGTSARGRKPKLELMNC